MQPQYSYTIFIIQTALIVSIRLTNENNIVYGRREGDKNLVALPPFLKNIILLSSLPNKKKVTFLKQKHIFIKHERDGHRSQLTCYFLPFMLISCKK